MQEHRHQVGSGCEEGFGESCTCQETLILRTCRLHAFFTHPKHHAVWKGPGEKTCWQTEVKEDCHLLDLKMEDADRLARDRVQWRSAVRWLLERIDSSVAEAFVSKRALTEIVVANNENGIISGFAFSA